MNFKKKLLGDQWKLGNIIFNIIIGTVVTIIGLAVITPILTPILTPSHHSPNEVASTTNGESALMPSASPSEATPTTSITPTAFSSVTPTLATPSQSTTPTQSTVPDGASIFLTDLKPVDKSYYMKDDISLELGGKAFPNSIHHKHEGSFDRNEFLFIEYNLSKKYSSFTATVGVNDEAEKGDQVGVFIVYVDGREAGRWESRLGDPKKIEIPVSGAQRIRLESGPADVDNLKPDLAWGTPKLHPEHQKL